MMKPAHASYFNEPVARLRITRTSRKGSDPSRPNPPVEVLTLILKLVVALAFEAEYGGIYLAAVAATPIIRNMQHNLGHLTTSSQMRFH